jgi:tRNA threonylcarbamoyladenosine biosynthesis protein TsaB
VRVLALETSGRIGSVALLERVDDQWTAVREQRLPAAERTARSLLPAVKRLLNELKWSPRELQLICTTTGPGSFTGLRLGVVTAKTIAYATGAKLAGVHTLATIAEGVESRRGRLWTVLDAERAELFVAPFKAATPIIEQTTPVTDVLAIDEWLALLQAGDMVAGPPLAKLRDRLPSGVTAAEEAAWAPTALAVGRLGAAQFDRGELMNPLEMVPNYFRKSAAEEKAASGTP